MLLRDSFWALSSQAVPCKFMIVWDAKLLNILQVCEQWKKVFLSWTFGFTWELISICSESATSWVCSTDLLFKHELKIWFDVKINISWYVGACCNFVKWYLLPTYTPSRVSTKRHILCFNVPSHTVGAKMTVLWFFTLTDGFRFFLCVSNLHKFWK